MSRNELVRWSLPRQDLRRVAQKKVVNMLLDSFEGKLTTEKWAKLIKSSHDTALRDIQDLIAKGILKQCLAPDFLDSELSVFMQRLRAQGVAGAPGLA